MKCTLFRQCYMYFNTSNIFATVNWNIGRRLHYPNLICNVSLCAAPSAEKSQQTMADVRKKLDKLLDFQKGFTMQPRDRSYLLQYLPQTQEELPIRSMKDSYDEAIIPLSTNFQLQDRYATRLGKVRMGRIMEDMDYFAVNICLKHINNPRQKPGDPSPYVIVTGNVDRIRLLRPTPQVTEGDVRLSGHVVTVGRSSMETVVAVECKGAGGGWELMAKAYFMMIARNTKMDGPAFVNKILPKGPEEEAELKAARSRAEERLHSIKHSLLTTPPNEEEQRIIHQNFVKSGSLKDPTLNTRLLPEGYVWSEDTKMSSVTFPHPENKNHHHTVFGGYLMRIALELAWMVAYMHATQMPNLRHISQISFKHPVQLQSLLKLTGQIVYTEANMMEIFVYIETMNPLTKETQTSNSFLYTYEAKDPVKPIMPRTYSGAMLWLDGRRELIRAKKYFYR